MARRQFLPALRGRGGEVETKSLADRVRSAAGVYTVAGQPYSAVWNVQRAVEEGFLGNPWVFRAVEVMAYTAIKQKIVLREGDPDDGPTLPQRRDPSRLLYCWNVQANPWETGKIFRFRLWCQWMLSSKGVFVEVARSRGGGYATFTLLDPDLTDPVPSRTDPMEAFRIRTTTGDNRIYNDLPRFRPDSDAPNSVLWLRAPHPTIMHRGVSPMEPSGLSADLDRYARLYNRTYMQSNGRPDGILAVKGQASEETLEVLENRFNGVSRPGKTTAIQADAMQYQDLSTAPRDMQWADTMDRMKKEVVMTFGVPESLLGDASGRTFDNADAEYAIFWEHRMGPLLDLLDDQLDVLTQGGLLDDVYLRHDTSKVWVLSRHKRIEEDRLAADVDAGRATIDDYRVFRGLPALDVPASRVLWIPQGKAAVADGATGHENDAREAASAPLLGTPMAADPGEEAADGAAQGAAIASYNAQTNAGAARLRAIAGGAQGRSTGGGFGALETRALPVPELEGKQGGARDGDGPEPVAEPQGGARPPRWR